MTKHQRKPPRVPSRSRDRRLSTDELCVFLLQLRPAGSLRRGNSPSCCCGHCAPLPTLRGTCRRSLCISYSRPSRSSSGRDTGSSSRRDATSFVSFTDPELERRAPGPYMVTGDTAEVVVNRYKVSRRLQDEYVIPCPGMTVVLKRLPDKLQRCADVRNLRLNQEVELCRKYFDCSL